MLNVGAFFRKLALLLQRNRFHADLDEEMAFHRDQHSHDLEATGMPANAARTIAARHFGNRPRVHDQSQQAISFIGESLVYDARYALRQMARAPGFTLTIILTLMLGIGANIAIFSVLQATLLRPLPYPESDRIVAVEDVRIHGQSTGGLTAVPRFFDLEERSKSFENLAFYCFENPTMVIDAGKSDSLPAQLKGSCVTSHFWQVLGIQPSLGRTFTAEDDLPHSAPVIVLSDTTWHRLFNGSPDVVGKIVTLDKEKATVIGIMPATFNFPAKVEIWRPARFDLASWRGYRGDGTRFVNLVGRLTPNATLGSTQAELNGLASQMAAQHPDTDAPWRFRVTSLKYALYGNLKPALLIIMTAAAMLLLIACVNVANLLSSRATARQREMALRQALGASRTRVLCQLMTESTLLSMLGGALGLALACTLMQLAANRLPSVIRIASAPKIGWPVAGFALALSLIVSLVFGSISAFHTRNTSFNTSLKNNGSRLTGTGATRGVFTSVQVGLSLVLLVGACLMAESLWKLTRTPLGFQPDHVVTFAIQLPWDGNFATSQNFYGELQRQIDAIPGVSAAGQISSLPTVSWHVRTSYDADWKPRTTHRDAVSAELRVIAGDYLEAMSIPLLAGRELRDAEKDAVLVNQEFARTYFAGGNVLGRHLFATDGGSAAIVGILGNSRGTAGSISAEVVPEIYFPANGLNNRSFAVRSSIPPEQLIPLIRAKLHRIDPLQSIGSVHSLQELLTTDTAEPVLYTGLLISFAALALLLACVGIYGVIAYSVAQRRQEIGVRMALGSTRTQISRLFLRRTMTSALIGLAAGAIGSLLLTRLLRSQLYGVEPNNLPTFSIAILLLLIPVLLAALRPALKAASVDPVDALRSE